MGGNNQPFVVENFRCFDVRFTSLGTQNIRHNCYETKTARTIDTGGNSPDSNQGGVAVVSLQGSMIGRSEKNGPRGDGINKDVSFTLNTVDRHGFNIHGVIFDELHTQPNRKLFDVMTKGSGDARMQPLYFLITTAGTDTNSICYETHQKAKDILVGRKHDKTFYPVIYGADEADDWTSPEVWKKANPSLGITIGMDKVVAACSH